MPTTRPESCWRASIVSNAVTQQQVLTTRQLLEAITPMFADNLFGRLEAMVLAFTPDWR